MWLLSYIGREKYVFFQKKNYPKDQYIVPK